VKLEQERKNKLEEERQKLEQERKKKRGDEDTKDTGRTFPDQYRKRPDGSVVR